MMRRFHVFLRCQRLIVGFYQLLPWFQPAWSAHPGGVLPACQPLFPENASRDFGAATWTMDVAGRYCHRPAYGRQRLGT